MDHQNIVKLYEVFEDDKNFYMVMQLLQGGELFDDIVRRTRYDENDAAAIMIQILSAVNYFHQKGFIHRDLKPENICLDHVRTEIREGEATDESQLRVKLIDFGTARKFTKGKFLRQQIGTPFYMSPEMFNEKKYNEKADIWSLGIVMYILLTGKAPYFGNDDERIIAQVKRGNYNKQLLIENKISEQALSLIQSLLSFDHKRRPSAE